MNKVAVYSGPGVDYKATVKRLWLSMSNDLDIKALKYDKFTKENLDKFDIVILPGGSGSGISFGLHVKECTQNLIDWVSEGGTIIGVCAGMYSMTKGYELSLGLINWQVADKPHWKRGIQKVDLKLTEKGKEFFNLRRDVLKDVHYHNGPIVERIDYNDFNVSNEGVLAYFDTEIIAEGSSKEIMKGSPAIIKCNYRNGLVIALSPHLEATKLKKIIIKLIKRL